MTSSIVCYIGYVDDKLLTTEELLYLSRRHTILQQESLLWYLHQQDPSLELCPINYSHPCTTQDAA